MSCKKLFGLVLALTILSSMIVSLPLVSAVYTYEYPFMSPDLKGDISNDGVVDIFDMVYVAIHYNTDHTHPYWDPRVDLNDDDVVDLFDLVEVAVNHGSVEAEPVAYSSDFYFTVPVDGDEEVWYNVLTRVYVPSSLSGQDFYFNAGPVDDWVINVKIDGHLKYEGSTAGQACLPVNVELGNLAMGYHFLEFVFAEKWYSGNVHFNVTTASGEAAELARFRVCVPNYINTEYRYTVKTCTYFPGDDFFLGGFADDFIDDVYVNVGLIWSDWEWDMGSNYGAIYAWGDGFMYPLGWQDMWRNITFAFGERDLGGLVDFQYISWTNQRDKIGQPKFYAAGNLNEADHIEINSASLYGGSKWKDESDPEFSERYYAVRQAISARYDDGSKWFDASIEVGLGLGWAEWALLPATEDDVGLTLNLTALSFSTNQVNQFPYKWFDLRLGYTTIDVYSFPDLEIKGIEYQEHDSFVKSDLTSAIDFIGVVILVVSGACLPPLEAIVGATYGLSMNGLADVLEVTQGQHVSDFEQVVKEPDHHYQLLGNQDLVVPSPNEGETRTESDILFVKFNPAAGKHCGLTKIVLQGTLAAVQWFIGGPLTGPLPIWIAPIANITIITYIPWFLRG